MGACYFRWACLVLALTITGCGGKDSPTSPSSPTPPTAGQPAPTGLRITGVPSALAPGATAQLKAEVLMSAADPRECAASWSVDDARVASVSASGVLTGNALGYFNVAAQCEGFNARAETKVAAASPYALIIVPFDPEVPTETGVEATIEFLDGPRAGESIAASSTLINNGARNIEWPVKVRFTAESYESREFVISEAAGSRRNPMSNIFDIWVAMQFTPDAQTDTYVRQMTTAESEIVHPFDVRVAGSVQVRTWWSVDYNDRLIVQLWCGNQMLRATEQRYYSRGDGFTHSVPAGTCEVRLRQLKTDARTNYRVAIRYPH